MSAKTPCPLDNRDRFLKFYEGVEAIWRAYGSSYTWTNGILALAIGWFLNSEATRSFIHRSTTVSVILLAGLGAVALLYARLFMQFHRRSQETFAQLSSEFDGVETLPVRNAVITTPVLLDALFTNWVLVGVLAALVVASR